MTQIQTGDKGKGSSATELEVDCHLKVCHQSRLEAKAQVPLSRTCSVTSNVWYQHRNVVTGFLHALRTAFHSNGSKSCALANVKICESYYCTRTWTHVLKNTVRTHDYDLQKQTCLKSLENIEFFFFNSVFKKQPPHNNKQTLQITTQAPDSWVAMWAGCDLTCSVAEAFGVWQWTSWGLQWYWPLTCWDGKHRLQPVILLKLLV